MRMKSLACAALALTLVACEASVTKSTVSVDGSSTVFPITEAMAEEFQKVNNNIQVTVGIAGTGGGFKRFCRGETHINDASRPIKKEEVDLCTEAGITYIELPVAYDGLAVMVNPSNDWVDYLTVAELKKIWEPAAQGTVTTWSQVRAGWPDTAISLYGPGVDSGTYDYFTEVVVGKTGESRGDFVASEDDNVLVQGIATDDGALGFFGYAYYESNKDKLKLVPVSADGTKESALIPTVSSINDGSYAPLSRPIFIYVTTKALEDPAVASFVEFYLAEDNVNTLVSEVGYVPLPEEIYALARERYENKTTGSVFANGSQGGVTLKQLLEMEAK